MEDVVKKILIDVIMNVILTRIIAAVPFLGAPIIGPIFAALLGKVFNMIGDELVLMIKLKQIDLKVDHEDAAFTESKNKLQDVLNKPNKSEAEIEAAKEEFKANFRRLIDFKYN